MKSKLSPLLAGLCCLVLAVGLAGCQTVPSGLTETAGSAGGNTASTGAAADSTGTSTKGADADAAAVSDTDSSKAAGTFANRTPSAEEQKLDQDVFPEDKVVDVKITVDKDDFQDMLDNASAEEYKQASVEYNGVTYNNIGIRTKGNLSLRSVVNSDSDRYSFKLSFDEYVDQTIDGISKINLNNQYSDASYMREFLAYELAEQMGLPVPKHSFVDVYVNGKLWGFYLAVEQIGDAYLERYFGNSYGALYKGVMDTGSDLLWIDDDLDSYPGLVQKSKSSDGDALVGMIDELNNGSDYESVLDVQEALEYIALQVVTNNSDSYIGGNKQNYYLYEKDGVFSVLPWDYNMAFAGMGGGMGGAPGGNGMAAAGGDAQAGNGNGAEAGDKAQTDAGGKAQAGNGDSQTPTAQDNADAAAAGGNAQTGAGGDAQAGNGGNAQMNTGGNAEAGAGQAAGANAAGNRQGGQGGGSYSLLIDEPTQGAVAERPLVAKLLAVDEYKTMYHTIIQNAIDGLLANDTFAARVQQLQTMISSHVKADPRPFYTYDEYETGVQSLISTNKTAVSTIQQQLDGTLASSGDGSGSGGMGGGMGGQRGGDFGGFRGAGAQTADTASVPAAPTVAGQNAGVQQEADGTQGAAAQQSAGGQQQADGAQGAGAQQGEAPPDAAGQQNPAGQQQDGADTRQNAGSQQQGAAGQGNAQQGADGADRANGQQDGGARQGGMGEPGGGFGGPGGMDGGGFDGAPGGFGEQSRPSDPASAKEAAISGGALVLLILASLFVIFYKRKRL